VGVDYIPILRSCGMPAPGSAAGVPGCPVSAPGWGVRGRSGRRQLVARGPEGA